MSTAFTTMECTFGRKGTLTITLLDDDFTNLVLRKNAYYTQGKYLRRNILRPHKSIVYLHQEIYQHYHGPIPKDYQVDHIDRNPLNNLPSNLRLADWSLQSFNRGRQKNNTSGHRGVIFNQYWNKTRTTQYRYWKGGVSCQGKRYTKYFPYTALGKQQAELYVEKLWQELYPQVINPNQ